MSEPNRPGSAPGTDRRPLLSIALLFVGAAAVAAILSTGAAARSTVLPANVSPPTISGLAVTGETLTSSLGSWTGTPPISFARVWERCDGAGASCAAIGGATAETYVVTDADITFTLRVVVTATNADGPVSVPSATTPVVTGPIVPVNTAEPVVSGSTVAGSTLSTTTGTWTGTSITYAYQWVRCDAGGGLPDGSDCPSIPGATSSSYALTGDDVGRRLRVQVTASNSAGAAAAVSNPTETVTQSTTVGPPVNIVEPTITGTFVLGRFLSASVGSWNGATPLTYAYQWLRCPADGGLPNGTNCESISDATSSSYTLSAEDVGHPMRIRVTASNVLGSQTVASNASAAVQSSATSTTQAPRNTRVPSISGTPAQGAILFASVGTWTGTTPLTYTYQWLRCEADGGGAAGAGCAAITGATIAQYTLTLTDLGRRLRVQVTARNTSGTATATSDPTALVQVAGATPPPPPAPPPPAGQLPPGAVRLPNGKYSIPITSVSRPVRLSIDRAVFTPNPVRSRRTTLVLRVHVVDTRGYFVRNALVLARPVRPVTSTPGERRTARDGWTTLRMTPRASFPLRNGSVRFLVRARKPGEPIRGGVSTQRIVQVRTRG